MVALALMPVLLGAEVPLIRHFTKEDYQAQYQNWSVDAATDDRIFVANNAGLLEFDGNRWVLHYLPHKQTVRTVVCAPDGKLFTGGFAAFGYWERDRENRLIYHPLDSLVHHPLFDREEIWKILATPGGIYFQSFSTLYVYRNGEVTVLNAPGNMMYLQQVGDQLILPVIHQGLYRLENDAFFEVPNSAFFADKRVVFILDQPGDWLIGTSQSGLFRFKDGVITPVMSPVNPFFQVHQINLGITLSNGNVAIGTISHGVYVLRPDLSVEYVIHQENGLQNNTVLGLHEDYYHDLWVALDKGVDLVAVNNPLSFYQDKQGGLGTVYAAKVFQNKLFVGTNHGLFFRPWPEESDAEFHLVEGSQGQVWDVQVFNSQLLVGHNDGTFTVTDGRWESISGEAGGWSLIPVRDDPNRLIQATYTGLATYRWNGQRWEFVSRIGNFSDPVNQILMADDGSLWAASPTKGLFRIWLNEDRTQVLNHRSFAFADGLPTEYQLHLQQRDKQILVGADRNWVSWSEEDGRFRPEPGFQYISYLRGTAGDYFLDYGDFVAYYLDTVLIQQFPVRLIPGYEQIVAVDTDRYLFCLEDGYALFDRKIPSRNTIPNLPPSINYVTSLDNPGYRFAPEAGTLKSIPYSLNNLRVSFHDAYFRRSPYFRYRFGKSDHVLQWSELQAESQVLLTNIPPGTYHFEIQSNASPDTASMQVLILRPWYQRSWAALLFVLSGILILFGLQRYHAHRLELQRRKMELEKARKLQQQEIKARNEQLQSAIINKSKELANTTFNLIRKNEILTQLKEEIQQMRKEHHSSHLRHEQHLLHLIDHHLANEQDWELFESNFNQVHEAFLKKLLERNPDLTPGDLRLAAYLKMNLTSKEIAPLLNISLRGVENKRYRLRSKLGLANDENLVEYLLQF